MASKYWVGGTGTLDGVDTTHISDTSGGAGGAAYPATTDDLIFDGSSGGGTVTLGYSPTLKSITMGAFTGTLDAATFSPTLQTFSNSGTGTRTLVQGSGTWTITGNNTTIWDWTTVTNLTFTKGTNPFRFTYSGATGTRAIVSASLAAAGALAAHPDFSITAGTDTVTINNSRCGHLVFTGFSGTLGSGIRVIYGNLTVSATMTWSSGTSTTTFGGTTGTQVITTNGVALNSPFTVAGVGGTVQFADNFSMAGASDRTLTLTDGTLDANNKNVTCGAFSSSNSSVRTLTMGSGTWTITGNAATIWDTATSTNLTITGGNIVFNYSGSTGTRTINTGSVTTTGTSNMRFTAGSDTLSLTSGSSFRCNDLDFTGFSGSWTNATSTIFGSVTLSPTMTLGSSASTVTMGATTTGKTITTNGKAWNSPITFSGVGGSWTLTDNLDMSGASLRTLTLTSGTFDANNKNVTCGSFASSNTNTRTLTMGSGTWTFTGTGTVWNIGTTTNLTFSGASSTIVIADISASSKTFQTGGVPVNYGTITVMPGGAGQVIFTQSANMVVSTFNVTGPKSIQFTSSRTYTVTNWNVNGFNGAPVTITSSTPATAHTISVASGTVASHYLSIQDSTATGGATFYAYGSTNVSGNTGWNFVVGRARVSNRVAIQNIPYSLDLDGSTGYISYGTHAAYALGLGGGMSIRFNLSAQQIDTNTANSRFLATLADGTLNNFITFVVQNAAPFAFVADIRSGGVSNTITSSPAVTNLLDSQWHDAAVIWGPGGKSLILDGVLVAFDTTPSTVPSLGATPNLVSGRLNSGINARYLTGNLQGLRLFSAGTTVAQIQDLHFRGITPSTQVSYWPGTEGSGTNLAVVGSGNAGTLVGGVTWSTDTPQMARVAATGRVANSGRVAIA